MGRVSVHLHPNVILFSILLLCILFLPAIGRTFDLEKDLQKSLQKSEAIIQKVKEKLRAGSSIIDEIAQLKNLTEDIRASHLLLQERFMLRKDEVMALGTKAQERHGAMSEGYRKALEEYLSLIDSLPSESSQQPVESIQQIISNLETLLEKILHKKKMPILGSLPYKHLNYPSKEPITEPTIKPAYKGGDKTVSTDDTKTTEEAPISEEIATLAQSLNWNPVSIYEYVKNNIETEWYWGCMKDAEETLRQKSGNDCDQATLLVALLRASGFPSRYVRGTIEFFAGRDEPIKKVKNLLGIEDPWKIAEFFQKAGVPYKTIIAGGKISNIQIEHIWVESQIPYANYRGAIIDEQGKTWLGLDTSIKVKDYQYNNPIDIFQEMTLSDIREEYLSAMQTQTPLEYIKTKIEAHLSQSQPDKTYNDLLWTKTLTPEIMNILPASMQFDQKRITHEYTEIPDELKHKVKFTAKDSNNSELLNFELEIFKLSNQRIVLTYEPETVEDQEIIDSYGGLDNTPAYLVRLRPVLKVNGERMIVAQDGLPMGSDYNLTIELIFPNGTERITNTFIIGNLSAIGIIAQKAKEGYGLHITGYEGKDAEQIMYEEAMSYIERWNQAEDELASLMHLTFTRPIPTVATVGGVIDVTYVLDTPHEFKWKGVYADANLRTIEVTPSHSPLTQEGDEERKKTFMQLSALQGSVLEHRIFEDDFQVTSVSTANLFQYAQSMAVPIIIIDRTNLSSLLPSLAFDENIIEDIQNSVNQSFTVKIPQSEIIYEDWSGIGYIKENPDTREAGYMLSGMVAGGETAITPEEWVNQDLVTIFSKPYSLNPNTNPLSAAKILKISATDRQKGTVGKLLPQPLMVFVVDKDSRPVQGASVTFRVIAGGGTFNGSDTYIVTTGKDGIVKAPLTLGQKTSDNPTYLKINTADEFVTQIGLNIVTTSVNTTYGNISITQPFEAYGKPDVPFGIKKGLGDGNKAVVNNPGGSLTAKVIDQYGNPISNTVLTFTAMPAESVNPSVSLPEGCRNIEFYKKEECSNPYPLYGECASVGVITQKVQYFGGIVWTLLGNTVNTKYTVRVTASVLPPNKYVEFNLYSLGYRENANDFLPPGIYMGYIEKVNEKGEHLNAAEAGTQLKAPLVTELFMYYEDYTMEGPYTCTINGQLTNCWRIRPSGITKTEKITDGTVTYTPVQGGAEVTSTENLNNGRYQTWCTTGPEPEINKIQAVGEATITVPEVLCDQDTRKVITEYPTPTLPVRSVLLKSGQAVLFDKDTKEPIISNDVQDLQYTVYGVEVRLKIEPNIIVLSEEGYTTTDTTFIYDIFPTEYNAIIADIDLYKIDQNNNEEWINYIPGDKTQVQGKGVIVAGAQFDINMKYEAQVVLNNGSDVEIRSERKTIPITELKVVNEDSEVINPSAGDEIKFSDGSKAKKRYHINLNSIALTESCDSLTGKIRSKNINGDKVNTPETGYYPSEYALDFKPENGRCEVRMVDTATGIKKGNFIVSNLSYEALNERLLELQEVYGITVDFSNTVILYGGIGNKVEIDINGAKKELPIEPVGVIVIGIDGLRQDVLYTSGEASYSDPQGCGGSSCNVLINPFTLPGLSQILKDQSTITMKDVTAIFPSITFASWASIYTGKQPDETGIPGNEFFARDRYSSTSPNDIPGLAEEDFPSGMVKLDIDNLGFVLEHNIPAEFWPVFSPNDTLTEKLADSTPGNVLLAEPLWEEINKTVSNKYDVSSDINTRCDESSHECRTVAMFNQYAEGVDWWGTPSISWANAFDALGSVFDAFAAKVMDKAATNEAVNFINNYFSKSNTDNKRKRFPALFSIYLSGLDHHAHFEGMGEYLTFFEETTDPQVREIVNALKQQDEFYNKIFIVVADHGHTAMPEFGSVTLPDGRFVVPDTSCKLKVENFDRTKVQDSEKYNNNLHIWELGNLFIQFPSPYSEIVLRVLSPKEIADVVKGASSDINETNIITGFNGPMAHIYVKGTDWQSNPDHQILDLVLVRLYKVFKEGETASGSLRKMIDDHFPKLGSSIDTILVRRNLGDEYAVIESIEEDMQGKLLINTVTLNSYFSNKPEYVNAIKRIQGMNNRNRSGDIILIMKDNMSDVNQRYTTGSACMSWHGSLNKSDSYVPFIVAYPGGNKYEFNDALNAVCPNNICDGNWSLSELIKEIVETQYSGQ